MECRHVGQHWTHRHWPKRSRESYYSIFLPILAPSHTPRQTPCPSIGLIFHLFLVWWIFWDPCLWFLLKRLKSRNKFYNSIKFHIIFRCDLCTWSSQLVSTFGVIPEVILPHIRKIFGVNRIHSLLLPPSQILCTK